MLQNLLQRNGGNLTVKSVFLIPGIYVIRLFVFIFFSGAPNPDPRNFQGDLNAPEAHKPPKKLRKLQFVIGFDVVDRYQKLLDFYKRVGFENEAGWVSKRLKWILN
jgi:hypothetical protein